MILAFGLVAAPEAPIDALFVQGDVKVEIIVGKKRGVDAPAGGVDLEGPKDGWLRVIARGRAEGPRPTVRVQVDGKTLRLVVQRGAQVGVGGDRLDTLDLDVGHTSRVDAAGVAVKTLAITASEAARVRARGESVTVKADRSARVVIVGKPKKIEQDVRGAASVDVEP